MYCSGTEQDKLPFTNTSFKKVVYGDLPSSFVSLVYYADIHATMHVTYGTPEIDGSELFEVILPLLASSKVFAANCATFANYYRSLCRQHSVTKA